MHKYHNIVYIYKTITTEAFDAIFNLFPREVGRRNDEEEKDEEKWSKEQNSVLKACSEVDYSRCVASSSIVRDLPGGQEATGGI